MPSLRKSDLVAIAMPRGPMWPRFLSDAWEVGAAVLPIDHRLPAPEVGRLLTQGRPTAVMDSEGLLTRLGDGLPVEPEVALVVGTSGSTGPPKLVELTHASVRTAVDASAFRLGCSKDDPWLCCLPLAHLGGMLVVIRALLLEAPLTIHARFDVEAFARQHEARFTALVPTMLMRLLDSDANLAHFEAVLVGGAELSERLAERARAAGARIVTTYGLTESCGGVVYDGTPLEETQAKIGDAGEIMLRGPTIMSGYRLDSVATAGAFRGQWLRTRDAGAFDAEGRLRVLGHLDEVIVTGGEKVWPAEVEAILRDHPAIADAAVIGALDDEWGQCVVALVVLRAGAEEDPDGIRRFAHSALAPYKVPKKIRFVEGLPRTVSGKAIRRLPSTAV